MAKEYEVMNDNIGGIDNYDDENDILNFIKTIMESRKNAILSINIHVILSDYKIYYFINATLQVLDI